MKRFLAAAETIAAIFLLLIALLIAVNVALRGIFDISVPDWFDGARLLLGIAMFWGIAIATYHAGHICVDAVWEMLGKKGRRFLDVLASLLTLAFLAPLAWMVGVKVMTTGTQATSDLRLPMMWFYAAAAAGAVIAVVLALMRAAEVARGHDPKDDIEELPHGS